MSNSVEPTARTAAPREGDSDRLTDIVDGLIERLDLRASAGRASCIRGSEHGKPRGQPHSARSLTAAGEPRTASVRPAIACRDGQLVGRQDELAVLRGFLVRAARGGDHLLWSGAPGVGKTAVLDAAVRARSLSARWCCGPAAHRTRRTSGSPDSTSCCGQCERRSSTSTPTPERSWRWRVASIREPDRTPGWSPMPRLRCCARSPRPVRSSWSSTICSAWIRRLWPRSIADPRLYGTRHRGAGRLSGRRRPPLRSARPEGTRTGAARRARRDRAAGGSVPDAGVGRTSTGTRHRARLSAGSAGIAQGDGRRRSGIGPQAVAAADPGVELPLLRLRQRTARCDPQTPAAGRARRARRGVRTAGSRARLRRPGRVGRGSAGPPHHHRHRHGPGYLRRPARARGDRRAVDRRGTPRRASELGRGADRPAPPSRVASRRCGGRAG